MKRMIALCLSLGLAMPAFADSHGGHDGGMTEAAMPAGKVSRAQFTTQVTDREPTDNATEVGEGVSTVYFFTELTNMQGQEVKHRWEYNGEVMAEVGFDVRGPRWRVWSSKNMMPYWKGTWTVKVLNSAGEEIASETMNYGG